MKLKILNWSLLTTTLLSAAEQGPISSVPEFFKVYLDITQARPGDYKAIVRDSNQPFVYENREKWYLIPQRVKVNQSGEDQSVPIPSLATFFEVSKNYNEFVSHVWNPSLQHFGVLKDGHSIKTSRLSDGSWEIVYTLESKMEENASKMFERKKAEKRKDKLSEKPEGYTLSIEEEAEIISDAMKMSISVGWPHIEFSFKLISQQPKITTPQPMFTPYATPSNYSYSQSHEQSYTQPSWGNHYGYTQSHEQHRPPKLTKESFQKQFHKFWLALRLDSDKKRSIQEEWNSIVMKILETDTIRAEAILKYQDALVNFLNNLPDTILDQDIIIMVLQSFKQDADIDKFEILHNRISPISPEIKENSRLMKGFVNLRTVRFKSLLDIVERYTILPEEFSSMDKYQLLLEGLCQYYSCARHDHSHEKKIAQDIFSDPEWRFDLDLNQRPGFMKKRVEFIISQIQSALPILKYIPEDKDQIFEYIFSSKSIKTDAEGIDLWMQNSLKMIEKGGRIIELPQDLAITALKNAKFLLPQIDFLKELYRKKYQQDSIRKLVFTLIRHSTTDISSRVMVEIHKYFSAIKIASDLSDAEIDFIGFVLGSVKSQEQLQELQEKLVIFQDKKNMKGRNLKNKKVDSVLRLQVLKLLLQLEKSKVSKLLSIDGVFSQEKPLDINAVNELIPLMGIQSE